MYLCMSFGFKGKYHMRPQGDAEVMKIMNHLYHVVRQHRGEFSKSLLLGEVAATTQTTRPASAFRYSLLWVPVLACALVAGAFLFIHHHLGETLSPLYQKLSHVMS